MNCVALDGPSHGMPAAVREQLAATRRRLESLRPVSQVRFGVEHTEALEMAIAAMKEPSRLPSARLASLFKDSGQEWTEFGARCAQGGIREMAYAGV